MHVRGVVFVVKHDNKCCIENDMLIPLPVRTARSGWAFYFLGNYEKKAANRSRKTSPHTPKIP